MFKKVISAVGALLSGFLLVAFVSYYILITDFNLPVAEGDLSADDLVEEDTETFEAIDLTQEDSVHNDIHEVIIPTVKHVEVSPWVIGDIVHGFTATEIKKRSVVFSGTQIVTGRIDDKRGTEPGNPYMRLYLRLDDPFSLPGAFEVNGTDNYIYGREFCIDNYDDFLPLGALHNKNVTVSVTNVEIFFSSGGFCDSVSVVELVENN